MSESEPFSRESVDQFSHILYWNQETSFSSWGTAARLAKKQVMPLTPYFAELAEREPSQVDKNTQLVIAAAYGHIENVRELLRSGAEVHARNDEPLRVAAANGHTETVKLLLKENASVHAEDDEALREAAKSGYSKTVALLLTSNAHVAVRDNEPLWLAAHGCVQTAGSFGAVEATAANGHLETIRALLAYGADARAREGAVLKVAEENGQTEISDLLKSALSTPAAARTHISKQGLG